MTGELRLMGSVPSNDRNQTARSGIAKPGETTRRWMLGECQLEPDRQQAPPGGRRRRPSPGPAPRIRRRCSGRTHRNPRRPRGSPSRPPQPLRCGCPAQMSGIAKGISTRVSTCRPLIPMPRADCRTSSSTLETPDVRVRDHRRHRERDHRDERGNRLHDPQQTLRLAHADPAHREEEQGERRERCDRRWRC